MGLDCPCGVLLLTVHGNVLASVAALWGLSVEELSAEELDVADPRFPLSPARTL